MFVDESQGRRGTEAEQDGGGDAVEGGVACGECFVDRFAGVEVVRVVGAFERADTVLFGEVFVGRLDLGAFHAAKLLQG
nr:hypothetical protein [Saccharopolyspora phatthalungensis]